MSYQREQTEGMGYYRQQSEATARQIDEACKKLVDEAYQRTLKLLEDKKEYIEKLGTIFFYLVYVFRLRLSKQSLVRGHQEFFVLFRWNAT